MEKARIDIWAQDGRSLKLLLASKGHKGCTIHTTEETTLPTTNHQYNLTLTNATSYGNVFNDSLVDK